MDIGLETRHLILGVHLFVAAAFLALGGLQASAGQTGAAFFRGVIAVLVGTLGVYLYKLRSDR